MTIFHVLKYPISDYPSEQELDDLPESVFKEWAASFQIHSAHNPWTTNLVLFTMDENRRDRLVNDLRKRLMEYNP